MVAAHRAAGGAGSGLVDLFRRIMVGVVAGRGRGVCMLWASELRLAVTCTSCAVQWRVSKRDVRDQLVLPPQETNVYWMQVRASEDGKHLRLVPGPGLLATCCDPLLSTCAVFAR
jgi:hypothetical protein